LNRAKNNFPVKVVRGGIETKINNFDVLVGDVVVLSQGDQVPADGLYISGFGTLPLNARPHWLFVLIV